jgi:hypothetical protein
MSSIALNRLSVPPLDFQEFGLSLYRKALTVFYIEERMKSFAKQGKCSFVASSRGHIITQAGLATLLKPGHDWFFTYYRSKGTAVGAGLAARDIFSQHVGARRRPKFRRAQYAGTFFVEAAELCQHDGLHWLTVPGGSRCGKGDRERWDRCDRIRGIG